MDTARGLQPRVEQRQHGVQLFAGKKRFTVLQIVLQLEDIQNPWSIGSA